MYAWPEEKKYPLNTKRQVRAAIAHFAAHRHRYPVGVQYRVGRSIRAAARSYGIHVVAF